MSELLRLHVIPGGRADQPPKKNALKEAPKAPAKEPADPEPLWREVLGDQLRELRREQQESLAETAARAGISPQYLSEVERGLKEPSSEMIAAVAGALGTTLGGLAESVADVLRVRQRRRLCAGEVGTGDVAVRRPDRAGAGGLSGGSAGAAARGWAGASGVGRPLKSRRLGAGESALPDRCPARSSAYSRGPSTWSASPYSTAAAP